MLIAYLDEFGHQGPFVSATDKNFLNIHYLAMRDISFLLKISENLAAFSSTKKKSCWIGK